MIKSLQKGLMKGAKKLRGLVDRILQKFKFKRFKLERMGKHIRLYGEVNPWVLLMDGELRDIKEQNLEKELKKLELDGKKPIKLSDAEYSKLNNIEPNKRAEISKGADGDKSKIDFNSVKGTDKIPKVTKGYDVTPLKSTYKERLNQTPVSNGKWTGERGESTFISDSPEVKPYFNDAGVQGVEYKNAVPDLSPFSKAEFEITGMSGSRTSNFSKADELLAEQWSTPEKQWTKAEVAKWRTQNKYTWHELNDGKTIQLIPSSINSKFGHLGGVSEVK
ncbi:HNH endonuclease [Paenibacillus sp. P32E]|uniref:HNH endonuclease n=1 Tax=Paenibacillus sp. P32E TaxID=1349434 RepID=UPI002116F969|nr:HNH endonuclease [Paenibacillus sp. P32E]